MTRGRKAQVGDTRTAPNGYHYTKTKEGWRLTHHIIAERWLMRPLRDNERCTFKDNDRTNLWPDNIVVSQKANKSKAAHRAQLEAKIEDLQRQLAELESE